MTDIKSMGLYRNVDRILADLAAAGVASDGPIKVDDLTAYDQYHYEGTDAVDDAIAALDAGPGSRVLDVGSGLGGPARYMADRTSSEVTALELQPDLHETATSLTTRCGLDKLVTHVNGNVLADAVPVGAFTGLVSMLCFLHIPERNELFAACAKALAADGTIFIDDYYLKGSLSEAEEQALSETVYCPYLPDLDTYVADLGAAGFSVTTVDDKTNAWTDFVVDRYAAFSAANEELVARYGTETVDGLDQFYRTVAELFTGGGLGGVRLIATRT